MVECGLVDRGGVARVQGLKHVLSSNQAASLIRAPIDCVCSVDFFDGVLHSVGESHAPPAESGFDVASKVTTFKTNRARSVRA